MARAPKSLAHISLFFEYLGYEVLEKSDTRYKLLIVSTDCLETCDLSEGERMELERKLIEYRKSDACLMKLKYMKLKNYLQEVHERQKEANLRNQTLLREFDQFEAQMKTSSSEMARKMEAWYRREIKRVLSLGEDDLAAEGDEEGDRTEQMLWAGISTKTAMPRQLHHPATGLMSHHTSAISDDGDLGIQQNPLQSTESCSVPDPPSCLPSLEGLGLESSSIDLERDAPVEGAARPGDVAASEEGSEELISSASGSKPGTPEEEQPQGSVPGPKPCLGNGWTPKEVSWDISPVLPVPASTEEVMPSVPQGSASPAAGWELGSDAHAEEDSPAHTPNPPVEQEELPSVSSAPGGSHGMLAALSRALELIEDMVRTSPRRQALYQGKHVVTLELLSFCNGAVRLKDGDLEACEAVVLHQLRASLQSTLNGCLLPENTLRAQGRAEDEEQSRPEQRWDMDMLRACLSNHALFLRRHQVQLPEDVSEMFESLLAQDSQALPGWREALPEESGDRSSTQSNESSCSLSCTPNDGGETEEAEHAPGLAGTGGQGVASWCEDESKEKSAVEKIPITGWDVGYNGSKARESQETQSETSPSSSQSLPLSRAETRKGTVAAIKSKAFWGESDESSSELEAALRPQGHSTGADEFDDFYD
ncbi:PREDICTED: centrosomal protein kizuna [Nestor notabilis]|uniref:centrosomal protein kizuna n=1 Tax=Nestor notabilis TaxID=176057 RepID=UPI00052396A7|nr:PREDICTED: centrosomal protein kizuna [Nestor notabilis]